LGKNASKFVGLPHIFGKKARGFGCLFVPVSFVFIDIPASIFIFNIFFLAAFLLETMARW
jgi:hypothetical protein